MFLLNVMKTLLWVNALHLNVSLSLIVLALRSTEPTKCLSDCARKRFDTPMIDAAWLEPREAPKGGFGGDQLPKAARASKPSPRNQSSGQSQLSAQQ
jgi:hypothetical protein